jgi:DUF218 domain-containing protein
VRIALAALAVFVALVFSYFYFVGTSHPKHADAIVVLAGDRVRISTAVRLFDEHVAPNLLVSLWGNVPTALCARTGVDCFHAHPFSTQGEAETVSRLARLHHWTSIVIVSSHYHLRRAHMLFRRCTHAKLQLVPARTTVVGYLENIPLELGKFAYQLTLDRRC